MQHLLVDFFNFYISTIYLLKVQHLLWFHCSDYRKSLWKLLVVKVPVCLVQFTCICALKRENQHKLESNPPVAISLQNFQ